MEPAKQFGLNVRRERERRGMSQEDLAFAAKIHPTQVSHVENGHRSPRFMTVIHLARALKVPPAKLFDKVR